MRRCTHKKDDGSTCRAPATAGTDLCFWHNPKTAKRAKAARAAGGRRRAGVGPAPAPKRKKKAAKRAASRPRAVEVSEEQLVPVSGARLTSEELEEYLASAIIKGINGRLSAPVLNNIVRLINVYEQFLNKKKDGGDVERARSLTSEQMHAAMLAKLPTPVLVAEARRRDAAASAEARKKGAGATAARPPSGAAPARAASGGADSEDPPRPGSGNGRPAADRRTEEPEPAPSDVGAPQDPPVSRW